MDFEELKKIELRKIWANEEYDFSPWLAKEENLKLLSKELGLDLSLRKTEANVGDYSLDILAEDVSGSEPRTVIIENQIEKSNHDHLGKVLLYASGFDADIAIWIAKEFTEPHLQTIEWLNDNLGENKFLFAVQVEVWQIGDSKYAPKFTVVCKPNTWSKVLKNQSKDGNQAENKMKWLNFWTKFHEYLENKKSRISPHAPSTDGWNNVSIGTSKAHLSFTARANGKLGCEIYIPSSKEFYKELETHKEEIENLAGISFDWQELPGKKASRIAVYREGLDLSNSTDWNKDFVWLEDMAHKFLKGFKQFIK